MSKMIQIRNVPDELHRELRIRAAKAGMSLSEFLLREVAKVAEKLASQASLAAPHLLDAEVGHLIRRHVLTGLASTTRAAIALEDFLALSIERYAHMALLPRAFELRHNATFYDALYLVLAEALEAPLLRAIGGSQACPG